MTDVASTRAEAVRAASRPRRRRMDPDDREAMILEGAVGFFARHGFSAQTRELARELGVSQSLIFRYFRNKPELIERVYQRNFMERWRDEWEAVLSDRAMPLRQRLVAFYRSYLGVIDDYAWIRISMFSGLSGNRLTKRYVETQVNRLLGVIARESAAAAGEPEPDADDLVAYERAFHLHSTFIYYLVRKHIVGTQVICDHERLIVIAVDNYLDGLIGAGRVR